MGQHREIACTSLPGLMLVASDRSAVAMTYTAGTAVPFPDKPGEGIFQISSLSKKNDVLVNFLHNVYVKSKCVALDVVKFSQEVAMVSIDIKAIECDGDLFRLCVAGVNAIIAHLGLKTLFVPRCLCYGSIQGIVVSDPDACELEAADWTMHVVMKSTREILLTEKKGVACSKEDIMQVLDRAFADVNEKV